MPKNPIYIYDDCNDRFEFGSMTDARHFILAYIPQANIPNLWELASLEQLCAMTNGQCFTEDQDLDLD